MPSNKLLIEEIIDRALAEDLGRGDVTSEALISADRRGTGLIVANKEGILAGINVAKQVFHRVDPELKVEVPLKDGAQIKPGSRLASVSGSIASILTLEYWTWYNIEEDYDYAYLLASEDGASWEILFTPSGTAEDPTAANLGWGYNGMSGRGPEWIQESVDISKFAGKEVFTAI